MSAVKRLQEKSRAAAKGKAKRRLGIGNSQGNEPYSFSQDATAMLATIMVEWSRLGGYAGLYSTSDGGALCLSLKHDDYEDEKVYLHDSDDVFSAFDRIQEVFTNG